jgi:plastocyanin
VVTVTGNKVSPPPATVDLAVGEKLTLTVTSDHADQLHIHGFEIEKDLVAGEPLSVTVTGDQPGVYEVETHHPELRLLKIAVK